MIKRTTASGLDIFIKPEAEILIFTENLGLSRHINMASTMKKVKKSKVTKRVIWSVY